MNGILTDEVNGIRNNAFIMRPNIIVNMQEYNPPSPEKIDELLQDLIKYIAVDHSVNILIKAALMYYQFETIHPFNSGNGRVGRLLPVLLLMKQRALSKGCLFISEYLLYRLDKVFLQCIIDSSNQTIKRLNAAVDERDKMKKKLQNSTKFSGELSGIYDFIEKTPIFMINDLVDAFHISYNNASSRVDMLEKMNIIKKEKE